MQQSDDNKYIPMTSLKSGQGFEVREDIFYFTNQIVNVVMIGKPGTTDWVLVDAGMPESGDTIIEAVEARFGKGAKPACILLTHGHFDHVGGIVHLVKAWDVPVYAHPLEAPFLTGRQAYPDPDASVEGGMLAKISGIYPHDPIDIAPALRTIPEDGSVPFLADWTWIHTPGHTPGHIAFFRESDRTLIAGDAFVTVRQDSLYKVLLQKEEVCGPPRYLTTDWEAAWDSVRTLEALKPLLAVTGHGQSMRDAALRNGLATLAANFATDAIPDHGKYLDPEEPEFK